MMKALFIAVGIWHHAWELYAVNTADSSPSLHRWHLKPKMGSQWLSARWMWSRHLTLSTRHFGFTTLSSASLRKRFACHHGMTPQVKQTTLVISHQPLLPTATTISLLTGSILEDILNQIFFFFFFLITLLGLVWIHPQVVCWLTLLEEHKNVPKMCMNTTTDMYYMW